MRTTRRSFGTLLLFLALSWSSAFADCVPLPVGAVSWWPAQGNALDAEDSNEGSIVGGVSFVIGKVGQAFNFDGSSGVVQVSDAPNLRFTNAMTVEAWIYPRSWGVHPTEILSKWEGGTDQRAYTFSIAADAAHQGQGYSVGSSPTASVQS